MYYYNCSRKGFWKEKWFQMFRFGIAVFHRAATFRRNVLFVQRKIPLISYFDLKYDQDDSISYRVHFVIKYF